MQNITVFVTHLCSQYEWSHLHSLYTTDIKPQRYSESNIWCLYIQKHCKMKKCSTISMCLVYHNWNNIVSYKVTVVGISYPFQQYVLHSCCMKKKWQVADEWRIKRKEDLRRHSSFLSRSFKFSVTLSWPGCSYTTDSFQSLMNLNTFVYTFRQTLVQIYKHIMCTLYVCGIHETLNTLELQ
jgi:hypothetical protein